MAIEVTMPRLTDSMDSATVVQWLIGDGRPVESGDELLEIETDKATMVWEAEHAGTLLRLVSEGSTVGVGTPIALLLAEGETPPARTAAPPADPANPVAPTATVVAVPAPALPPAADGGRSPMGRVRASPVARRIAARHDLELAGLPGSGPGGRVLKRDVERVVASRSAAVDPNGSTRIALSSVQATIAERMVAAKTQAPDFTVSVEADMAAAVELRRATAHDGSAAFSYNDLVIRACATALADHPRVNASFAGDAVAVHDRIDIGVAVAAPGTLLVPAIRDAARKPISAIATETRDLAQRGRAGRLTPAELEPGTFTLSNLGMLGVTQFTAVLNAGQAAILAVGAVREVPVVRDGTVVPGTTMAMTLTADHRVLYGADAAAFLAEVRELLEQPLRLLL